MYEEAHAISQIERRYMTKQWGSTEVILQDLDFSWLKEDIKEYCQLWREGKPFTEIAEWFGRDMDELALLHLHLARKGRVRARKGGLM